MTEHPSDSGFCRRTATCQGPSPRRSYRSDACAPSRRSGRRPPPGSRAQAPATNPTACRASPGHIPAEWYQQPKTVFGVRGSSDADLVGIEVDAEVATSSGTTGRRRCGWCGRSAGSKVTLTCVSSMEKLTLIRSASALLARLPANCRSELPPLSTGHSCMERPAGARAFDRFHTWDRCGHVYGL